MHNETLIHHPDLITDEQINAEYYLLSSHGRIDRDTVQILRAVRKQLPYSEGDFRQVEVVPYRDEWVNYQDIVFDLAAILETDDLLYGKDETTIFIEKQNARTLAQVGVLFDIKPSITSQLPMPEVEPSNFEDDLEMFWNSGKHHDDIPSFPVYESSVKVKRIIKHKKSHKHSPRKHAFARQTIDLL